MLTNLRQIMLMKSRLLVDNQMNISLEIQMPHECHFIMQSKWKKAAAVGEIKWGPLDIIQLDFQNSTSFDMRQFFWLEN